MLGEPRAEKYATIHTDPHYLIRIIPAEGSNQVAPSLASEGGFFMFKRIFEFFVTTSVDSGETTYLPTMAGLIAMAVVILLIFIVMMAINKKERKKLSAKQLAFSAVAIALTVITSVYTVYRFPFGGSITLFRMLFICLIGYLYGAKIGILTGVAYGFLDLILDPYIVHPAQLLLDYPVAFGFLGLSGIFSKAKYGIIKGYIIGVFGRYLCHIVTGVIFFSAYAGDQNPLIYSIIYNGSYILPEAVITIALLFIPNVRNALSHIKRMATQD